MFITCLKKAFPHVSVCDTRDEGVCARGNLENKLKAKCQELISLQAGCPPNKAASVRQKRWLPPLNLKIFLKYPCWDLLSARGILTGGFI